MFDLVLTLAAIFVPLIGMILLYRFVQARKRRWFAARLATAAELGWQPAEAHPFLNLIGDQIYREDGKAERMVTGEHNGHRIFAVDFTYVVTGQKSARIYKHNLVALMLPVALPLLVVKVDNPIARGLGLEDLELESQQFNDTFWVQALDKRFASAFLHPQLMEWLLQYPNLEWRIEGNLLVSWGDKYWTVLDALAKLDGLAGIAEWIPRFVVTDYGKPTEAGPEPF